MSKRVVSLLPSATEIVCAVGGRPELVGVSHECDHPIDAVGLPILTFARMVPSPTSMGIHRSVQEAAQEALAIYGIERERLLALKPDVIVTQDLCDVCAVSFDAVCDLVEHWLGSSAQIVSLQPQRLADIWSDIRTTAAALGREKQGERALEALQARVESVRKRAEALSERPRVVTLEWIEPPMLGGLWMAELVTLAGGEPLGHGPGEKSRMSTEAELAAMAPDVLVIKPCGFKIERTLEELHRLPEVLPWSQWPAVREGRVFVADGNAYFNRPGPRIVDSLEILAACMHPDAFADVLERYPDAAVKIDPTDFSHSPWS